MSKKKSAQQKALDRQKRRDNYKNKVDNKGNKLFSFNDLHNPKVKVSFKQNTLRDHFKELELPDEKIEKLLSVTRAINKSGIRIDRYGRFVCCISHNNYHKELGLTPGGFQKLVNSLGYHGVLITLRTDRQVLPKNETIKRSMRWRQLNEEWLNFYDFKKKELITADEARNL